MAKVQLTREYGRLRIETITLRDDGLGFDLP